MRRIYLLIIIFLFLLSFIGGYYVGCSMIDDTLEITQLKNERDSLSVELVASKKRARESELLAAKHHAEALRSDSIVVTISKHQAREQKKHEDQIRAIKKATVVQLDNFLAERYPEVLRPSYNKLVRQIVIPEWRARQIAVDLVRLDSVSAVAGSQDSTIWQQIVSIAHRDTTISAQLLTIKEKDKALEIVLQREMTWENEAMTWKNTARKYKRQRNIVIAGVTVSIGAAAYFLLKR